MLKEVSPIREKRNMDIGRGRKAKPLAGEPLWQYALRALAGRALSTGELRLRLRRRAEQPSEADTVIARLKDLGFLDDKRLAESYATARLENQGFGRGRVLRDLRQRRVAPGLAEKAVQSAFQGSDEIALIEQFLARKYRKVALPEFLGEPRNLASAFRRLRYAGFTSSNAIRVLKRYSEQAENLEAAGEEDKL